MADRCAKFLKVLKAELEDLLEDIALVEKVASERLTREEISDYVYRENDGLLRLEAVALRNLILVIDGIDLALYKNADDLAADLDLRVKEIVREHEDPEAVYRFFLRKLRKVREYVDSGE
jgi:hypothetical protein